MAKDTKNAPSTANDAGSGGVNPGVAIIGFFLCFLAGVAVMWVYDQHRIRSGDITADNGSSDSPGSWDDSESPVPVSSKDPMWGKRDAPVTIAIWSDFQCPFCSKVEPTLAQVKEA